MNNDWENIQDETKKMMRNNKTKQTKEQNKKQKHDLMWKTKYVGLVALYNDWLLFLFRPIKDINLIKLF